MEFPTPIGGIEALAVIVLIGDEFGFDKFRHGHLRGLRAVGSRADFGKLVTQVGPSFPLIVGAG